MKKLAEKQRSFEKMFCSLQENNKLLEQNNVLLPEMKENSLRFNIIFA